MNEFSIIKKYLKPLAIKDSSSINLSDDIYFNKNKKLAISTDTYVEGVHFINSLNPEKFIKKILRSSLSDLYCKGILPQTYFLSLSINKKHANHTWMNKIKKLLKLEQNRFKINLGGGDTTYSSKLVITITVIGFSKNKPVLRKGALINDDIYVTGNIADAYLGLCVIKKKFNFGSNNYFFKKKFYEPDLPSKISPYLHKIANASIDISDGLGQDLKHLCNESNHGGYIDLNCLPLSQRCQRILLEKKIPFKNIFSNGDDYQILFTSNQRNRTKVANLSKKLSLKITRIGIITKDSDIVFNYNGKNFKLNATKMGYTHTF